MVLQSLFLGYTVLSVGFSLTDPDFLGVIEDLHSVFGDALPTSYALIRQPTAKQQKDWKTRGVKIIPYTEHQDLRSFFAEFHEISERKYPNPTMRLLAPPSVFTRVSEVKAQAWAFYSIWRREGSLSPRFGKVDITLKGWRHMVRVSRSQAEVCHKLSLLRCAKELIEKATQSVKLRQLDRPEVVDDPRSVRRNSATASMRETSGGSTERELHLLRGRRLQPFRPAIAIEVVLEVTISQQDPGAVLSTTFYSVYERR
jgi:hypothetical protein